MENFIGEIRPIAFSYAPRGWLFCAGQILAINQNQALFSLLGTTFGGDGATTFRLPDLQGRIPIGTGNGYNQGQTGGAENASLTVNQMPTHIHDINATINVAAEAVEIGPTGQYPAAGANQQFTTAASGQMAPTVAQLVVQPAGGSQPHENRQPFQVINYIIALNGIYPSRP